MAPKKPTTPELLDPHDRAALARWTWDAWTALHKRAASMIRGCKTPSGLLALARVLALAEEALPNVRSRAEHGKNTAARRWDRLGLPGIGDDPEATVEPVEGEVRLHTISGTDDLHTEAGEP